MRVGPTTGLQTVNGPLALEAGSSLGGDGLFVMADRIEVQAGASLSLGAGVVLKWDSGQGGTGMDVEGTLTTAGTESSPVVFTSFQDDAVVGDSDLDGGADPPAPGDWGSLTLQAGSDASVLDGLVVRYGGQLGSGGIRLLDSDATLANSRVESCSGPGLSLAFGARPAVDGCLFLANDLPVSGTSIAAVPGFTDNDAAGNAEGDSMVIDEGTVSPGGGDTTGVEIGPANAFANALFVVRTDVAVAAGARLAILGGATLAFDGPREVDVDGVLTAGSTGSGVTLTSHAASPAPGDWVGIDFGPESGGSVLQDVLLQYAGRFGRPSIDLNAASVTLNGVTIEDGAAVGLHLSGNSRPAVLDCTIERCTRAVDGVPIDALPGFAGNATAENQLLDALRITDGTVAFDVLVEPPQSPGGRPFVVADDVDVLPGTTLTLVGGTFIKWEGTRQLDVDGTLVATGSEGLPVTLTSLFDDTAGDTNKDGTNTLPGPGDWQGIAFGAGTDASVLAGTLVRHAGAFGAASLDFFSGTSPTVVDCTVQQGAGDGLDLRTSARPAVRRTAITDHLGIAVDRAPLGALPLFDDATAANNALGDVIRVTSSAFAGDIAVAAYDALNGDGVFRVATGVTVPAGQRLTLRQGVIFKWDGNRSLTVNGGLDVQGTGLEPVVLTSLADDEHGGDTLGDGAATAPAPGDWGGLLLGSGAQPGSLEHLLLRFGGSGAAALDVDAASTGLRSVRVDSSAADGARIGGSAGDLVNFVAFGCAGRGLVLQGGAFDVVHATVALAGGAGVERLAGHTGSLVSSIAFGNPGGETVGFGAGEVLSSNVGPPFAGVDGNVDADPQFADLAGGDLSLGAASPCLGAADLLRAIAVGRDHLEASRVLDSELTGAALPDMGAYERATFGLAVGGQPQLGTTLAFTPTGPAGTAFVSLGLLDQELFLPPFGMLLAGDLGGLLLLGTVPVGQPVFVPVPDNVGLVDLPFGVQALALSLQAPGLGNLTNLYRGRVFP